MSEGYFTESEAQQRTLFEGIKVDARAKLLEERIGFFTEKYGKDAAGYEAEDDSNEKRLSFLKLTERTRVPFFIDWQNNPAEEVVSHNFSVAGEGEQLSGQMYLKKDMDMFDPVVTSIKKIGHLTPNDYEQLTCSTVVGHPGGKGKHAIFLFQTPSLPSGELTPRLGERRYLSHRNSAIEIPIDQARDLMVDNEVNIVDFYERGGGKFNRWGEGKYKRFSYVPPERILGMIQFRNFQQHEKFLQIMANLKSNYWNTYGKPGTPDEKQLVEAATKQSLSLFDWPSRVRSFIRNRPFGDYWSEADPIGLEDKLRLFAVMITRDELTRLCAQIYKTTEQDLSNENNRNQLHIQMAHLKRIKPSYPAHYELKKTILNEFDGLY